MCFLKIFSQFHVDYLNFIYSLILHVRLNFHIIFFMSLFSFNWIGDMNFMIKFRNCFESRVINHRYLLPIAFKLSFLSERQFLPYSLKICVIKLPQSFIIMSIKYEGTLIWVKKYNFVRK